MLTPLELDIMKAVWDHPPITVKDVQTAIRPHRQLAYTTVMTIMDRLFKKGFLKRELKSRTHYYEPAVGYTEVRDAELARLIENFFDGSAANLAGFLRNNGSPVESSGASLQGPSSMDETLL